MDVNLISDTVTKPTKEMLDAMFSASVGDDVLDQDITVKKLERKIAAMFGKEAAIFCPSGTMTNQLAVNLHTKSGDLIIGEKDCHIYNYEVGAAAALSGVTTYLIDGDRGKFTANQISSIPEDDGLHFCQPRLVCIENTTNRGGGVCWDWKEMKEISDYCRENGLKCHLDGARFFNAMIEKSYNPLDIGPLFDTISICFSKGLGAPVGSVLLGTSKKIARAKKTRKRWGGGMRQSGYSAAAAIYALDHHIKRLKDDHRRAKELEKNLQSLSYVKTVIPVETNIVLFFLDPKYDKLSFLKKLSDKGIIVTNMGNNKLRMVTHLDFTDDMLAYVLDVLKGDLI